MAVVLAVTAAAPADEKTDKIDVKKLVGKWEPKLPDAPKGPKMVIEFTKDGKASFSVDFGGKEQKFDGTYKAEGNKLTVTMKINEKEDVKTRTISKLTDTELVSKDEKGKEDTLTRVK